MANLSLSEEEQEKIRKIRKKKKFENIPTFIGPRIVRGRKEEKEEKEEKKVIRRIRGIKVSEERRERIIRGIRGIREKEEEIVNTHITKFVPRIPQKIERKETIRKLGRHLPKKVSGEIDIFNFESFPKDYKLFSTYFEGVELYLRLAIWLQYRYDYNFTPLDQEKLDDEVNKAKDKKEFLMKLTEVFITENLVEAWYKHFCPSKLHMVEKLLDDYVFAEDVFFNRLYRRYVDPNWEDVELWFEKCQRPRS